MPGAMGSVPLSWQELLAWAGATETQMTPGDLENVRELSAVFVNAAAEYRGETAPAPFGAEPKSAEDINAQIHKAFAALMERK